MTSDIVSSPTIDLLSLQTSISQLLSASHASTFQLVSSSHTSISQLLFPSSSTHQHQSFNITTMTIIGAHFILTIFIVFILLIVIIYIWQKKKKRRQEVEGVVNSTRTEQYPIELPYNNNDTLNVYRSNKRQETTRFYHELEVSI